MIYIENKPFDISSIINEYPEKSIEREILQKMSSTEAKLFYNTANQLKFELKMRKEIVNAANALNHSRMSFEVFRESRCNPDFWVRTDDGGFALKQGVKASDAIADIFKNGSLYGTECATAMLIIYYKALLDIFPKDAFDRMFSDIYLMNWHQIAREIREVGTVVPVKVFLPGDRRYFKNPDVDPLKPELQGENVIDMGNELYFGHGIGKYNAEEFINFLNNVRKRDAKRSAYLMDLAGNPNYTRLSDMFDKASAGDSTTSTFEIVPIMA